MRESAVMISSTMPSAKYSCSGSPPILANGNTAIDGLSGKIGGDLDGAAGFRPVSTTPIKRMSLRGNGADQPLDFTAVADRPAHRADAASQGRFGDDPPTPYRGQQVVLADHPVAVLQEIDQEIEDLRFEGDRLCAPPLLPPVRVEHMIAEGEFHFRSPGGQQSRRIKRGLSSGLRR